MPTAASSAVLVRSTYYVHVMKQPSRTLYTGVTDDLERRLRQHKLGIPGSFTARYSVKRLVYFEEFGDICEAIAREKAIKRMSRAGKTRLVESRNPRWKDLGGT